MNQFIGAMAAWPIESLLNRLLSQDDYLAQRLAGFRGKTLQIKTHGPSLVLCLLLDSERIAVKAMDEHTLLLRADATVEGSMTDLLGLLRQRGAQPALANPAITISGDALLVRELHDTLLSLDVDWQDYMAPVAGDIVTQQLAHLAAGVRDWGSSTWTNLGRDIEDYAKQEARLVPSREQWDSATAQLDELKLQIDRVAARAALLRTRLDRLSD